MKKVDETIEDICDWIQKELDNDVNNDGNSHGRNA